MNSNVRKGLVTCLNEATDNENVQAILLIGDGRTFFAGADISEFGKPMQDPNLTEVIAHFEGSSKPVVAALHGTPAVTAQAACPSRRSW